MEKKALEEFLEEVAKERGFGSLNHMLYLNGDPDPTVMRAVFKIAALLYADSVKKAYARECCQASLNKAAQNATRFMDIKDEDTRDKYESINDPSNIVILE